MLKRALSIFLCSIFLVFLLGWISFVLKPLVASPNVGAELVSGLSFWPSVGFNIPFRNGRYLVFSQCKRAESNKLIFSLPRAKNVVEIPKSEFALLGSYRNAHQDAVITTWNDLPVTSPNGRSYYELNIYWVNENGIGSSKRLKFDNRFSVLNIGHEHILIQMFNEQTRIPVLISLSGNRIGHKRVFKDFHDFGDGFLKNEDLFLFSGIFGESELVKISLNDGERHNIAKINDPNLSPKSWAFGANLVVWSEKKDDHFYISFYNFFNNERGVIIKSQGEIVSPVIYKGILLWAERGKNGYGDFDIYGMSLKTREKAILVEGPGDQVHPEYFGRYLYWTNIIDGIFSSSVKGKGQAYVFRKKMDLIKLEKSDEVLDRLDE